MAARQLPYFIKCLMINSDILTCLMNRQADQQKCSQFVQPCDENKSLKTKTVRLS